MKRTLLLSLFILSLVPACGKKKTEITKPATGNIVPRDANKTFTEDSEEFVLEDNADFNVFEDDDNKNTANKALTLNTLQNDDSDKNEVVQFEYDSSKIRPSEQAKIAANAKALKGRLAKEGSLKIAVKGHSCKIAKNKEYNYALSQERASKVADAYEEQGISRDKLKPVGFGSSMPVNEDMDEEKQSANRRAETSFITN